MERDITQSLKEISGNEVELGVTKLRQKAYPPATYVIPIFIHEKVSLAEDSAGNIGAIPTEADWLIYDESEHGLEAQENDE